MRWGRGTTSSGRRASVSCTTSPRIRGSSTTAPLIPHLARRAPHSRPSCGRSWPRASGASRTCPQPSARQPTIAAVSSMSRASAPPRRCRSRRGCRLDDDLRRTPLQRRRRDGHLPAAGRASGRPPARRSTGQERRRHHRDPRRHLPATLLPHTSLEVKVTISSAQAQSRAPAPSDTDRHVEE